MPEIPDEVPVVVIACYRPRSGCAERLDELMADHVPILRSLGLVTDRAPIAARASDGTVVEVFEWRSQAAIDEAHTHPEVLAMWGRYDEVSTYVPVAEVEGAGELFTGLTPL